MLLRINRNGQLIEEYNELDKLYKILNHHDLHGHRIASIAAELLKDAAQSLKAVDVAQYSIGHDRLTFITDGGRLEALGIADRAEQIAKMGA